MQTFNGQCQCGAIVFTVQGTPLTHFACHCLECQQQSSSAFGMALWVQDAALQLHSGSVQEWVRQLPSGRAMACRGCARCGSRLFHCIQGQDPSKPQVLSIKSGTLQGAAALPLAGHIWTQRKHAWVQLGDGVLQYPANPPRFDALFARWAELYHPATSNSD